MLKVFRNKDTNAFITAVTATGDDEADAGCDESANELRGVDANNAYKFGKALVDDGKACCVEYTDWSSDDFDDDKVRVVAGLPLDRVAAWSKEAQRQCGRVVSVKVLNDTTLSGMRCTAHLLDSDQRGPFTIMAAVERSERIYSNVPKHSPLLWGAAVMVACGGDVLVTRALRWVDLCFAIGQVEAENMNHRSKSHDFEVLCQRAEAAMVWRGDTAAGRLPLPEPAWEPILL